MSGQADQTDDAILSAYLDRELPQDEIGRLTERLAADPALRRRLEQMRSADAGVRKVFESADETPIPQGVLDLLKPSDSELSRDARIEERVVPFPMPRLRRYFQAPVAIAASVALVAGLLVGELVRRAPAPGTGVGAALYAAEIPEASELHHLLESGVSTEPQVLASGADARVLLTFENVEGDFCRQFQVTQESGYMQALACRRAGAWQMEAAGFDPLASPGTEYQAASSPSPALDAAIDAQIGANEPLGPDEESLLVSREWIKSGD